MWQSFSSDDDFKPIQKDEPNGTSRNSSAYCPPDFMGADHSWSLPGPRVGQSCGLWDPGASVPLAPAPTGTVLL